MPAIPTVPTAGRLIDAGPRLCQQSFREDNAATKITMRLALFHPDIAGNVGTIIRLAACLGAAVDLIEPMGFPFGDRAMIRAGMDYVGRVEVTRHPDWAAFRAATAARIVLLTTAGATPLCETAFRADDVLLFGSESTGVPPDVHAAADLRIAIPMQPGSRSLNVAVAAGIALAEALRQTRTLDS